MSSSRSRSVPLILVLFVAMAGLILGPDSRAGAEEKPAAVKPAAAKPAAKAMERIWRGYLWKDRDGRIRIGWPVIAMGVMAQPAHVVEMADPARLTPLLTPVQDSHVFWNYTVEAGKAAFVKLPKVLVTLRGMVQVVSGDTKLGWSSGSGTHTMRTPRIERIEFVTDAWLEAWAPVFTEAWSPWRIRNRPEGDAEAEEKKLAARFVEVLRAMRKVAGPGDAQRKLAQAVDPKAVVSEGFRKRQEADILRWIHRMNDKHKLALAGLAELGSVPPTGTRLRKLFLAAKDRAAFLASVKAVWKGPLDMLQLPYYRDTARGGVTWAQVAVSEIATGWKDDAFLRLQRLTRKTLAR